MQAFYRSEPESPWELYRCPFSGRKDLDSYEANYRCRWLVERRFANEAEARDGERVVSRWVWRSVASSVHREFGPDL